MKTFTMNHLKTLGIFLLIAVVSTGCAQSKKSETAEAVIATPQMDLQAAVISNNLEAVRQHIKAGSDLNQKDAMSGSTPLITASSFGKKEIAQALIEAGADLTPKNNDGATALHAASFFCRVEIVQALLDAKADKTAKNNFGMTPRESIMGPYAEVKPIYEMLQQSLAPMGLDIDLNDIEKTRPVIAMMLQ